MDQEQRYKSIKSSIESRKTEQLQIQADINSIDTQLAELQTEATNLGINDLSQLPTLIQQLESSLDNQLTTLEQQLNPASPVTSNPAPAQPVSQPVQTTPVQPVQPALASDLDLGAFDDFGF